MGLVVKCFGEVEMGSREVIKITSALRCEKFDKRRAGMGQFEVVGVADETEVESLTPRHAQHLYTAFIALNRLSDQHGGARSARTTLHSRLFLALVALWDVHVRVRNWPKHLLNGRRTDLWYMIGHRRGGRFGTVDCRSIWLPSCRMSCSRGGNHYP